MNRDCTIGFLLGLAAGAVVGVLYAPKSGDDFRRMVMTRTKEGTDGVRDYANELWDTANGLVERGRTELYRQEAGVKNAMAAGQKAYQETAG